MIKTACFKGGGMLGNAYIGVAKALEELNILQNIECFIGSSAGAIFASLLACRISCRDLDIIIRKTDYSKFKDSSWGLITEGGRLIENYGLYKGEYFYKWYQNILNDYIGDKMITFLQVYERYKTKLVITTINITKQEIIYMDKEKTPNMSICDAVRRSMSIPILFIPIKERDKNGIDNYYIDGGYSDNFPLDYISENQENVIGFDLLEKTSINEIYNITSFFRALIYTNINIIDQMRNNINKEYKIIKIPTFELDSMNFSMSKEDIEKLIESGYKSTIDYLSKK